ncbi:helix-turn-helix domain-containing protein [Novispirillum sp. DQ9]|uniref:helix-turn-helix domain-containing protein n=1 Tax=Novispirillum sp. DQ9 TaxID=3398612 RepID=UPI003C7AE815
MAELTLSQAAKLAGKSKSTLSRALSSGKLSAAKREGNQILINVAELERVYGPLPRQNVPPNVPEERSATPSESTELALLKARMQELEQDRKDLREQLEQERAERTRLVTVIQDQAKTMRLLEDHRPPEERRSWWRRLIS